jgi:uncharacterized protein
VGADTNGTSTRMSRSMSLALWLVAIVLGALALIWAGQRRMIYFPTGAAPAPAAVGLAGAEAVRLATGDGLRLQAWFLPAAGGPSRFTAVVFNGNAGHRGHRAELARALSARGIAVLLFDYRGYGGNPGTPSEAGLALDARAARAYVTTRSDVDPRRLVYFGESLGAAVALELAVADPPAGLILRSPFTSLADVGRVHYPVLPVGLLLRDRYPSIDRVSRLRCPLLVVAGSADAIVPVGQSRRLHDAATAAGVASALEIVEGADHNDLELLAGDEMLGAVEAFLQRLE